MKILAPVAAFFICATFYVAYDRSRPVPPLEGFSTDFKTAQAQALKEKKPLMVVFSTEWCGYCRKLERETFPDAKVRELGKKFVKVKVDGDKERAIAEQFGVSGYPTIVFFSPDGKGQPRYLPGYLPPKEFSEVLEMAIQTYGVQ